MKKINLIFICSNLNQGGAEKQLVNLISSIDRKRFRITVFLYAAQVDPFYIHELKKQDIKLKLNLLENRFFVFKILDAMFSINFFLKQAKYDIVVTSLFMNNLFVRLSAPRSYENKIVTNMRTSASNYSLIYRMFEFFLIRKSYIVFNSKKSFDVFKSFLPKKTFNRLFIIYNGFFTNFNSSVSERKIKAIGCLGRISVEKNFIQVVKAFQANNKIEEKHKLIIQGYFGSQYLDLINSICSKNILVQKENINVDLFFDSIDILIIPSFFEGCPNVLFEGLLRRKFCIISEGANSDNFIIDNYNGIVYDGTDIGLTKAIINALDFFKNENGKKIINNGYNYALKNFSIKSMVKSYEELFIDIYEKNKSSY